MDRKPTTTKRNGLQKLLRAIVAAERDEERIDKIDRAARIRRCNAELAYMMAAAPRVVALIRDLPWKVYDSERYYVCADTPRKCELGDLLAPRLRQGSFRIANQTDVMTHDFGHTIRLLVYRGFAIAQKWWAPPKRVNWDSVKRLINTGALDTAAGVKKVKALVKEGS